jgi:hypothetical protein
LGVEYGKKVREVPNTIAEQVMGGSAGQVKGAQEWTEQLEVK